MTFCGACGKRLDSIEVEGEFNRYTGKPIVAQVCPDNHEGWKYNPYSDDFTELGYDDGMWYEVRKAVRKE